MVRDFRKPMVVASPKMLLRHPACVSKLGELGEGTHFQPVLADQNVNATNVKKVIFVSGKHYYTLKQHREAEKINDTALIRVEVSLCTSQE